MLLHVGCMLPFFFLVEKYQENDIFVNIILQPILSFFRPKLQLMLFDTHNAADSIIWFRVEKRSENMMKHNNKWNLARGRSEMFKIQRNAYSIKRSMKLELFFFQNNKCLLLYLIWFLSLHVDLITRTLKHNLKVTWLTCIITLLYYILF